MEVSDIGRSESRARQGAEPSASTTGTPALQIELRVPTVLRTYAVRVAAALARAGHHVAIKRSAIVQTPATVDWLLDFERLMYRTNNMAFAPAAEPPSPSGSIEPDLIVDLAGDAPVSVATTLRVLFDEGAGEAGLLAALLDLRAPVLHIVVSQAGDTHRLVRRAVIAVERPVSLAASLDMATARLAILITQAVADLARPGPVSSQLVARPAAPHKFAPTLAYAAHGLRARIAGRLDRLVRRPDCWRIAVRTIADGRGVIDRRDWSGPAWRVLSDDGRRYYADPFLVSHAGRRWMFCEEYPHATAKGILSVAAVGDDGAIETPEPFLETTGHLSWPQVFMHDDQVFMVPETVSSRSVQLWRAVDFPHRWELDRVLIDNIRAHDPVLHITPDRAFMVATLDDDGGSSWDALGLFSAPDLFGPWEAHPGNPIAVDASCMRAAGPLIARGGELWRATQDCRTGYGRGLSLCRVTQLDAGSFAQEVVARLAPPPVTGARGVHTLSQLGSLEAIDLLGLRGDVSAA